MKRNPIVGAVSVAVLLGAALPAFAQLPQGRSFNPRISVDARYVDNVAYVNTAPGDNSDWVTRLQIGLPWAKTGRRSTVNFSYTPSFERHLEFKDLTRDEHRLTLGTNTRISDRSSFNLSLSYNQSQNQSPAESLEDPDLFLDRRTERQVARVALRFRHGVSRKTNWDYGVAGSALRFGQISGFDDGLPPDPIEDRSDWQANLGLARTVSQFSSIRLSYAYRQFDLDQSGTADNHSMNFGWNRTATRNTDVELAVGVYRSAGKAQRSDPLSTSNSTTGGQLRFSASRTFREAGLRFDVTHVPSVGGSQPGTSTNTTAGMTFRKDEGRHWSWRSSARYSRRDPTLAVEPTLSSVSIDGSVERGVGRSVSIELRAGWAQQGGDSSVDDASRYSTSIGLVWYPRRK